MRRTLDWLALFALAAACAGCATVAEWFGVASEVVADPAVQEHAGGVVANVITGNWWGAATSLGELLFAGGAVYKGVMMRREGLRKKRGEPTAKDSVAITPEMAAVLAKLVQEIPDSAPPADAPPGV